MSDKLRIVLIILVIVTDLYTVRQIRHGRMSLNHSLLWIFVSLILLLFALFPGIAVWLASVVGMELPINMIFLSFSLFSIILFVYLTNVISKEDKINRRLTQQIALLERRIRELEENPEENRESDRDSK
ncbi:MAG: DUF2304 domain-containing protein [Clostridia bacterium]|nr:DUF2304 domain-containing protein [Clostridia bacterium]